MDKLFPIKLPPGMRNTGTPYQSAGRWYTGNFVRFFQDCIQPIGGWTARTLTGSTVAAGSFVVDRRYTILTAGTTDFTAIGAANNNVGTVFTATGVGSGTGTATATILGVPRAMLSFRLTGGTTVIIIACTGGVYVISGTTLYDITPAGWSNVTARVPQLDVMGQYAVMVAPPAGVSTGGELYYWTGNTATAFTIVETGPVSGGNHLAQDARSVVVTPERFCVMIGGYVPEAN